MSSLYPKKLRATTPESGPSYSLAPRYLATKARVPTSLQPLVHATLGDNEYVILEGDPKDLGAKIDPRSLRPVYSLEPGGSLAVATGLVFLRFSEGVRAVDKASDLSGAGYEIVETQSYAPHTAWLAASDGSVASALEHLARLAKLDQVERVEPQLLSESVSRS